MNYFQIQIKNTLISRKNRYISGISKKYFNIEDIDTWLNRFPKVIHYNIKEYDARINYYIHLFKHKLMILDF